MKRSSLTCLFLTLFFLVPAASAQHFSAWSAPVNVGPPVNTVLPDSQPFITKDGLNLYFGILEGYDANAPQGIWVAHRGTPDGAWGEPQELPATVNITGTKSANPFVTVDGHWMYFNSNRKTPDANGVSPFGRNDIYAVRRQNKREDFGPYGWQEPVNLGAGVNTSAREQSPWVFEDDLTGITTLYFNSDRFGSHDIFMSKLQPDGTFGSAELVSELSSPYSDESPTLSRDGLTLYFISDRPGSTLYPETGQPAPDIWVSTRASTSDLWGVPENLDVVNARLGGPPINSPFHDARPSLSFDGTTLYFTSAERVGNLSWALDIWKTTRSKVRGGEEQ